MPPARQGRLPFAWHNAYASSSKHDVILVIHVTKGDDPEVASWRHHHHVRQTQSQIFAVVWHSRAVLTQPTRSVLALLLLTPEQRAVLHGAKSREAAASKIA